MNQDLIFSARLASLLNVVVGYDLDGVYNAGYCCDLDPVYEDGDEATPPHWTVTVNENDENGREVEVLTFSTEGAALEAIYDAIPVSDEERHSGKRQRS